MISLPAMPNDKTLTWLTTVYAKQYLLAQAPHFKRALRTAAAPTTLVIGRIADFDHIQALDLPFVCRQSAIEELVSTNEVEIVADNAFLPFAERTFATVILLHSLETSSHPHQTLREAYRVLAPEGHLILAGFNPYSLVGVQRKLSKLAIPAGQSYSVKRVLDWLNLLNFDVVGSAMFQYGPLSKHLKLQRYFAFLESIGDRWFPLLGGAYMLTAKKREMSGTLVGKTKRNRVAARTNPAPIKTSLKQ